MLCSGFRVPGLPDVTQVEEVVGLRWCGQQVVQCLPGISTQIHHDTLASVSVIVDTPFPHHKSKCRETL